MSGELYIHRALEAWATFFRECERLGRTGSSMDRTVGHPRRFAGATLAVSYDEHVVTRPTLVGWLGLLVLVVALLPRPKAWPQQ